MKKKVFSVTVIIAASFLLGSCNQAGKYADDVIRVFDDKVDDIMRGKVRPRPPKPKRIDCDQCIDGVFYDFYGNAYTCNKCGGRGWVFFN